MQSEINIDVKTVESKPSELAPSKSKIWDRIWIGIVVLFIAIFSVLMWYFYGHKSGTIETSQGSTVTSANEIPTISDNFKEKLNNTGFKPNPIAINPIACSRPLNTTILQPPNNLAYVGFHLDWNKETPLNITRRLDFNSPAVINAFIDFSSLPIPYDSDMLEYFAQEVSRIKGILQLTVVMKGMENIPDYSYEVLADHCRRINSNYGVPILLRYGSEMNGGWFSYGLKPIAFKQSFIKMANAIHSRTNLTAMMWTPNIGYSYPFSSKVPARSSPDFIELDTNKDGRITYTDDPYGPFYPGDEYVDWVGLSLYWYTQSNEYSPLYPMFQESLVGEGGLINQIVQIRSPLQNFYEIFAKQKNKPMAIAETGAPVLYNDLNGRPPTVEQELTMKRDWWRQLWSDEVFTRFPLIKLILNFEEAKLENKKFQDWRITWNETILSAFKQDMRGAQGKHMSWSLDYTWTCGGLVSCFSKSCSSKSFK